MLAPHFWATFNWISRQPFAKIFGQYVIIKEKRTYLQDNFNLDDTAPVVKLSVPGRFYNPPIGAQTIKILCLGNYFVNLFVARAGFAGRARQFSGKKKGEQGFLHSRFLELGRLCLTKLWTLS